MRLRRILPWAAPLFFVCLVFYAPLTTVLASGFNHGIDFELSGVWPILWFTIWQALLSGLLCILLGVPAAYIFYKRSFRSANLFRSLISVPFMLPSIVVAIAITQLASLFGGMNPIAAILLANLFSNYAVVVRTVGAQWQLLDDHAEEAAEVSGAGRLRVFFSVSLPQLTGSIRAAGSLIVLYCVSSYGLVLSLGGGQVNTLETAISTAVLQRLDLRQGSYLAILQIIFSLVAFGMSRVGGSDPLSFGSAVSVSKRGLDRRDSPMVIFVCLTVSLLILLPMALVSCRAFLDTNGVFSFVNFSMLQSRGTRNLLNISFFEASLNSLRNMAVATGLALLVGIWVSWLLANRARKQSKLNQRGDLTATVLDSLFTLPIGVSAVVLGLGYLLFFSGDFLALRSSWFLVPLAQSALAVPMVIRVLYPALANIDQGTREQAMTDGASVWAIFWRIDLAAISPAVRTAIAFSALVSLGEFGAASLLAFGDQSTVPMLLFSLISRPGGNNFGMALAVAVILIVITSVTVLLIGFEPKVHSRRRPRRRRIFLS